MLFFFSLWYWFYMQPGFVEKRLSARSKGVEHVRIRPVDPRYPEKVCTPANISQNGLLFMSSTGNYFPGMEVLVTRNFHPGDPLLREERAIVVRVHSLGSGHQGVAVQIRNLPQRVLFVCVGNSCRSPMAEALARHMVPDAIIASSAGLAPLGYVCQPTLAVLAEIGVPAAGLLSRVLRMDDFATIDLLVNMAGRPLANNFTCPTPMETWNVQDPFGCDLLVYRRTRDDIARRITQLAQRLRTAAGVSAGPGPDRRS